MIELQESEPPLFLPGVDSAAFAAGTFMHKNEGQTSHDGTAIVRADWS